MRHTIRKLDRRTNHKLPLATTMTMPSRSTMSEGWSTIHGMTTRATLERKAISGMKTILNIINQMHQIVGQISKALLALLEAKEWVCVIAICKKNNNSNSNHIRNLSNPNRTSCGQARVNHKDSASKVTIPTMQHMRHPTTVGRVSGMVLPQILTLGACSPTNRKNRPSSSSHQLRTTTGRKRRRLRRHISTITSLWPRTHHLE